MIKKRETERFPMVMKTEESKYEPEKIIEVTKTQEMMIMLLLSTF
jgi:hypothetical protein